LPAFCPQIVPGGPFLPAMPVPKHCAVYNLRFELFHGMEEVIGSIPTTFVDNRCTRGLFPFQCFHYLAAELPEQPGLTDGFLEYAWCPSFQACMGGVVSAFLRNTYQRIERVEGVELIEKYERIVYSMDSGISLKRKALLRSEGSSPFFGTKIL